MGEHPRRPGGGAIAAVGVEERAAGRREVSLVVAAVLMLAFVFQGSRGIWEPDEGYYVNVSQAMFESGDWLVPRLNGEAFLDKPPLLYWSAATGMSLLGENEWGARCGQALFFAATALVVGLLAARWWGRRTGCVAALVYASSLAPFLAANVLTADTPLAFASAFSYYAFWRVEESSGRSRLWGAVLGVGLGLGVLAKGPALLVACAPLPVFLLFGARWRRWKSPGYWIAAALFVLVAAPWYAYVLAVIPGAGAYILDNQVTGRLVSQHLGRNPGWAGGFRIYLPTLLVGSLPWSLIWLRRSARPGGTEARRPRPWSREGRPEELLLLLWIVLPLAVFWAAQSRLPLYVLPVFAPLALLTARRFLMRRGREGAPAGVPAWTVAVWVLLLLAVKGAAAWIPSHQDSRALAQELDRLGIERDRLIVTLDTKKNGLSLYGWNALEMVSAGKEPYPMFSPIESLAEEVDELATEPRPRVFVVDDRQAPHLRDVLARTGHSYREEGLELPYVAFLTDPSAHARAK
ncbi:MAG: glycosyltransferase family 39 protein [Thermoanaerobaculia bacterium]